MNQTDEVATKRVFGVITWTTDYFLAGLTAFFPVTGLSYITAVLLQELIVFSYKIQVYCASMVYSDESATQGHINLRYVYCRFRNFRPCFDSDF